MLLEEAAEKAGLDINNVAKTHLFLKHSGLPDRRVEDLRLKVNGDLNRFDDIVSLVQRFAKSEAHAAAGRREYYTDDGWHDDESWWPDENYYGDDWSYDEWSYDEQYYGDEHSYGDESWTEAEGWHNDGSRADVRTYLSDL